MIVIKLIVTNVIVINMIVIKVTRVRDECAIDRQ